MISIINKRAYHDYTIREEFTAGITLSGPEVKSIKRGRMDLAGSFVVFNRKGSPELVNAHIPLYPPAANAQKNYDPHASRQLLLTKREINFLRGSIAQKGYTIIPLKIFTKHRLIKITIGLAEGKKKYDKREAIKKRDIERDIRKRIKQYS